ncbi:MAG: D-alanyl-D-alanine carboxypeptidase family protein, partial [Candidatus Saccharimonadales bacterium]
VTDGEQISEFQALETMLLPSANNMADSLARWAFGSVNAYITYANQMVKSMGLTHTTVGDANGFTDTTTSTADDLVKLGIDALNDPALAQITSQSSAQVPAAGTIKNTNWLLGTDGVVGIKTGNTDQAGGCYLFAAQRDISGHKITLVGAVLDVPTLNDAISAAKPLIEAGDSGFEQVRAVYAGQPFGYYEPKWGKIVSFSSSQDLNLFVWKGQAIKIRSQPKNIKAPANTGTGVGTVTAQSGQQTASSSLVLNQGLAAPSWSWRIFR